MNSRPSVLLVGGPDVDARLPLMHHLAPDFNIGGLGSDPSIGERFAAAGYPYTSYHLHRRVNPPSDVLTVSQLILIFRRLRPHIVHTFDLKPGIWGGLAARTAGVPVVISTLTGLGSTYALDSLATRCTRTIYEQLQKATCQVTDLTIFQNHDDSRQFIDAGLVPQHKTKVILGSGVSVDSFNPAQVSTQDRAQVRNELGIRPGELVVTMISRIMRSKGVLDYMAAAATVGQRYPEARFVLLGSVEEKSADRLLASELEALRKQVIWPGARPDIQNILAISDIFVLPTAYREGIPRVLLEAASMMLPIVTTDSPGCNEIVEHGLNGFLVPVHDSAALGERIGQLIEEPELRRRFGQASRKRVIERFTLSIVAEQTRSVYQQLLAQKAHGTAHTAFGRRLSTGRPQRAERKSKLG